MGLFDKIKKAMTKKIIIDSEYELRHNIYDVREYYHNAEEETFHDLLEKNKTLKNLAYSNIGTKIEENLKQKLVKEVHDEITKPEIYNKIKQMLTDETMIRNYMSKVWKSDNDGFYIELKSESDYLHDNLFKVKLVDDEQFGFVIKMIHYFKTPLHSNRDHTVNSFKQEIEKIDFSQLLKYDPSKIYAIGTSSNTIYIDQDKYDIQIDGLKIKSIDDLYEDYKMYLLRNLSDYFIIDEVIDNVTLFKNFNHEKIKETLKNRINEYIKSLNKDMWISEGWNNSDILNIKFNEEAFKQVKNIDNISISSLNAYLLGQNRGLAKEILRWINKDYNEEIERIILESSSIKQSAFVAGVDVAFQSFGGQTMIDYEYPQEYIDALVSANKQPKDVIQYEKFANFLGETIKEMAPSILTIDFVPIKDLIKVAKVDYTVDFIPDANELDFEFMTPQIKFKITFMTTKFNDDTIKEAKKIVNDLYDQKIEENVLDKDYIEKYIEKIKNDYDFETGNTLKNTKIFELADPDINVVEDNDLTIDYQNDGVYYADLYLEDKYFAISDVTISAINYKKIAETITAKYQEIAQLVGLAIDNIKVDSSGGLKIYADIKQNFVREMYKDLNWTKLTADIEKQMDYLIPIIKQDQTDYINEMAYNEDLIQYDLVNVEALQKNSSEILVEFEFSLKDKQIVLPYKFDIVLLTTPSHGITYELTNGKFNLNIPTGLLAKYQFNINNFVELKSYIMKKYGNLFEIKHADITINEFNESFERHLYFKVESLINDANDIFSDVILPKAFPNSEDIYNLAKVINNPSDQNFKFNVKETDTSIILKTDFGRLKMIFSRYR